MLRAPRRGARAIGLGGLPELEIDPIGDDVRLRRRMRRGVQRGDFASLRGGDGDDGGGAEQRVVEEGTATGIEDAEVELVAAQERDQGTLDPGGEDRRGGSRL